MTELPPPFVVMGMPRSRTYWLSKFLSPLGWACGHEELRYMRSIEDVRRWLSQPLTGACETAAAPFWRTLRRLRPDCKLVVVRRPPGEVVDSFSRLGLVFDHQTLHRQCTRLASKLDQVAARWPDALVVDFEDLALEACCAEVFEHCIGAEPSHEWWAWHHGTNLQANMTGLLRYLAAYAEPLQAASVRAREEELARMRRRHRPRLLARVSFRSLLIDQLRTSGEALMTRHCEWAQVNPETWRLTNWPLYRSLEAEGRLQALGAWVGDRLVGYVVTAIGTSFEDPRSHQATHLMTFVDPAMPGLGPQLLREANRRLAAIATEILFEASEAEPRFANLAKRLGAIPHSTIWRLEVN